MAGTSPLISVVIVSYKVPAYLHQTLRSLAEAERYRDCEIIIVDNASNDNSRQLITKDFPAVAWVQLKDNIGFGRACNVGVQMCRGEYVLLLNPDMLVSRDSLSVCLAFLQGHPDVGIVGPKILKPDGSFQPHCRRSFPTPLNAFFYMFGLSRLFPTSPVFGRYNFTYVSPDTAMEVDAVSGCFMFMRRSLYQEVGGFDEAFFMYAEDLDLCARVKERGYKVWYCPDTQVIHFKGKSCARQPIRSRMAFYEAMIIFSRKYRRRYHSFLPNWLIVVGIVLRAAMNILSGLFRSSTACLIDLVLINATLLTVVSVRFSLSTMGNPYGAGIVTMLLLHALLSTSFVGIYAYRGVYAKERYSVPNMVISGLIASMIFMVSVYFVKSMALSRIAFGISTLVIIAVLIAWRQVLPRLVSHLRRLMYSTGTVAIIGNDPVAVTLIKNFEGDKTARIAGIIWPVKENYPGEFEGYPVLGHIDAIKTVLRWGRVDLLLIATAQPWYSYIIEALATVKVKHLTIRWVPVELFSTAPSQLPGVIPLRDFSV
jgi:O-antigen biosynthesis protein